MGASSSCGGCFSGLVGPPKVVYEPWVPREPPAELDKLSVQARLAARKCDDSSLDIVHEKLKQTLFELDEQGRSLLFYSVRGTRTDTGDFETPGGSMAGPSSQQFDARCTASGATLFLVKKYGLDVNFQVHDTGMTPLMEAVRFGNLPNSLTLLQLGADSMLRNAQGDTALDIAKKDASEYLTMQEANCSFTHFVKHKASVTRDRLAVANVLEDIQKKGGFEKWAEQMAKEMSKRNIDGPAVAA